MPQQVGNKSANRLLLAHSANFIKLSFMVVNIFLVRLFCTPRLLRSGETAPRPQLRHCRDVICLF